MWSCGDGASKMRSTIARAVSIDMSTPFAFMPTFDEWQYEHAWLQRSVTARMWSDGP